MAVYTLNDIATASEKVFFGSSESDAAITASKLTSKKLRITDSPSEYWLTKFEPSVRNSFIEAINLTEVE